MSPKEIAQEIIYLFGIQDKSVVKEAISQLPRVANHLNTTEEKLPEKFVEMLKELEANMGQKSYNIYFEQRSKWLKENKDILMLIYDLEANCKLQKMNKQSFRSS